MGIFIAFQPCIETRETSWQLKSDCVRAYNLNFSMQTAWNILQSCSSFSSTAELGRDDSILSLAALTSTVLIPLTFLTYGRYRNVLFSAREMTGSSHCYW